MTPNGGQFLYATCLTFSVTNNAAEYEALVTAMELAEAMAIKEIEVFTDSQLVHDQTRGSSEKKSLPMAKSRRTVAGLKVSFDEFEIKLISREHNQRADQLAKWASRSDSGRRWGVVGVPACSPE